MAFGLSDEGLQIKRLEDIKTEMETSFKAIFGNGINLQPTSVLGQIIGIHSEREAKIWELVQAVYDASYPDTASGTSLDNAIAYTGIRRLEATKSTATVTAFGTEATVIPANSQVSVSGDPTIVFETLTPHTIGPGTDEVQTISFSGTPDAGSFTVSYDGDETNPIDFSDNAATLEAELEGLVGLTSVNVAGSFAAGFTVDFVGVDGEQDQPLLVEVTNTLEVASVPVTITIAETTPGVLPNVDLSMTAVTAGSKAAPANTLTVIETPVAGWDTSNNALDAVIGKDVETDAEARIRRDRSLAFPGSCRPDAIRAKLSQDEDVKDAVVFQNVTDVTDAFGLPPHSMRAIVFSGDYADIFQVVLDNGPAGIYLDGTEVDTITDSQGIDQTVRFSRPTEVEIHIEVDITGDADFVSTEDDIKAAIIDYAEEAFSIGDDVIVHGNPSLAASISCNDELEGIVDLVLRVGTSAGPTLDDNISIDADEIAVFDTSRITVVIS